MGLQNTNTSIFASARAHPVEYEPDRLEYEAGLRGLNVVSAARGFDMDGVAGAAKPLLVQRAPRDARRMAILRRNILADPNVQQDFGRGVNLLKQDFSAGVTTQTLGFGGQPIPVSAYDQFVIWHYVAMNTLTHDSPTNVTGRNSAHRGPIFLPWHRFMLLLFEHHLFQHLVRSVLIRPIRPIRVLSLTLPIIAPVLAIFAIKRAEQPA